MSLLDDDEKTVIRPVLKQDRASASVAAQNETQDDNALPLGSRVGEFEIRSLIGVGGFGIVYLAHDHSLGRDVALKEYMPSSLAARIGGVTVGVKSQRHAETFAAGLGSFINEARLLAQFDSPSLVKVYRFWEANGTAYMVMPFYEGLTLKQALLKMTSPPSEEWLKSLLVPLIEALQLLHHESCFHRDIAPDNILLLKGGRPVLLDFGAARRVIGDLDKALTVILKPGYAPIEQYADEPNMRQGAWTDIYAVAAVIHYAIMGKPPMPSVGRLISDTMVPLEKAAVGRYSEGFLRGLDRALAVRPEDRPQSVAELRDALKLGSLPLEQKQAHLAETVAPTPDRAGKTRMGGLLIGIVVAGLAIGAVAYFVVADEPTSSAKVNPPDSASGVSTAVGKAPIEAPSPAVAASPVAALQSAVNAPPVSQPEPVASVAAVAFDPVDALTQLYERRERDRPVSVSLEKSEVKIGKEKLRFRIQSERPGYLYIMMVGTDKGSVNLLFPNALDRNNRVAGGKAVDLPRSGWSMTPGGPPGTDQFVAMVSDEPRDFSKVGMTKVGPFSEFSSEKIAPALRSNTGEGAVLAGLPVCSTGGNCSIAYGAAKFSIEEIK